VGGVLGGGVVGLDVVEVGEAGVDVAAHHFLDGGVGPVRHPGRAVGGRVEGVDDVGEGLAADEEIGGQQSIERVCGSPRDLG